MTVKRFRLFIASDVQKEEKWLTEMSRRGLHFYKYRFGIYYFEESPDESYIYQIDFLQSPGNDYFQLYKDAGWENINNAYNWLKLFHYFRTEADNPGMKKIYSDKESVKESYQRMLTMYITIFCCILISQIGIVLTWRGYVFQIAISILVVSILLLYIYLFISLKRKINFYRKD
ncbi:DUF2812 domain-containing protein [Virgibacillus flavescens]|uniref:DUF2812 domain-containing protein n=1 Tax=Virgibacillus flavescens TaxID=1611422 RepID=UPI003D338C71